MSLAAKSDDNSSAAAKKPRVPTVRSVEAVRWASLQGKMTAAERRRALSEVAAKMR